ncbi:glycine-rich domain-containing protein [Parafrankia sp. FMc2]|uniref:glycine-rich domain-containing protein n=1 Tax=Parafrankia sp. FMc2 TaxID=3233196 RepID=UPI0034D3F9F1
MTAVALEVEKAGRFLVRPALFDWLVDRVAADVEVAGDRDLAARIVDQALAFLATSATSPHTLAPSRRVDIGWHAFVLHTREYADFCNQVAGRFIHHIPESTRPSLEQVATVRTRTTDAIAAAGYALDVDLWTLPAECADEGVCKVTGQVVPTAVKCHPCTDQGCSASGKDGNENGGGGSD